MKPFMNNEQVFKFLLHLEKEKAENINDVKRGQKKLRESNSSFDLGFSQSLFVHSSSAIFVGGRIGL